MAGSGVAALFAEAIGTSGLLLASVVALVATVCLVVAIISRETRAPIGNSDTKPAGGLGEALALVRGDANLRQIAWLVSLAAIGSVLIDQQLNMAAEQFRGSSTDSVTSFLASVRFLLSSVSLLLQVFLVKQIYRLLGLGFALVTLPVALAARGESRSYEGSTQSIRREGEELDPLLVAVARHARADDVAGQCAQGRE